MVKSWDDKAYPKSFICVLQLHHLGYDKICGHAVRLLALEGFGLRVVFL